MAAVFTVAAAVGTEYLTTYRADIIGHGFTLISTQLSIPPTDPALIRAEPLFLSARILHHWFAALLTGFQWDLH